MGRGNLLELGWLGNGLDYLLSIGLLKIFSYSHRPATERTVHAYQVWAEILPVLCDTVVAVAVVVEIDLEVKESVVHYCSAVVIKSFGAIINVLVTFFIFYHLVARKKSLHNIVQRSSSVGAPKTDRRFVSDNNPVAPIFYLLSKSSPTRCIWNKTKFHCLFRSQHNLISRASFIWTLKISVLLDSY